MSDSNVIRPKSSSSEDEYYKQWIKYRILEEAYNHDKRPINLIVQISSFQATLQ